MKTNSPRIALVILLLPLHAQAANWHQSVSVPVTVEYDSNPTMSTSDEEGIWRARVVPRYTLTGTFGRDEYNLGLGLTLERSSDTTISDDRLDPDLSLGWQRQTETGGFGVTARYDEASTRVTELAESGLLAADGSRKSLALGGNWRSAISERSSLSADVGYSTVSYDGGTYTDYSNLTGSVSYNYVLSERAEPFLRATASHYEPEDTVTPSSDNYSLMAGVNWKVSERLDWTAQGGLSRISGEDDETGWQASFVLHYQAERSNLALDIGRYVSPTGEGGYAESDRVGGAWSYDVDDKTRAGIDVSWQDYKGATANTTRQVGVWASRELTPLWTARLSYQYRQRDEDAIGEASANVIGLTLVYTHPEF